MRPLCTVSWRWMNLRAICLVGVLLDMTAQGWAFNNCTFKNSLDQYSCGGYSDFANPENCKEFSAWLDEFYGLVASTGTRRKRVARNAVDPANPRDATKITACIAQFYLLQKNQPGPDELDEPTRYEYAESYGCISDTNKNIDTLMSKLKMNSCQKQESKSVGDELQTDEACICNKKEDCNLKYRPSFGKILKKLNPVCGQKRYEIFNHEGEEGLDDDASLNVSANLLLPITTFFAIVYYKCC